MSGKVRIGNHVIIGSGSVIMPGVTIGAGVAIGAMSFVKGDCAPWSIYAGVPAKLIGKRNKDVLLLEKDFLKGINNE
jgi:galactoside O-acetyltransferase